MLMPDSVIHTYMQDWLNLLMRILANFPAIAVKTKKYKMALAKYIFCPKYRTNEKNSPKFALAKFTFYPKNRTNEKNSPKFA